MKKLLFATAFLVSFPALAEWILIGTTDQDARIYIDVATIRTGGDSRRFWSITDRNMPSSDGTLSVRVFEEVDCKKEQGRTLQEDWFAGQMARGAKIGGPGSRVSNWEYFAPETVGEAKLQAVCKSKDRR